MGNLNSNIASVPVTATQHAETARRPRRRRAPVPLSEHEQRLLDEIEQALYAEDPKFASSVRAARGHSRLRRTVVLCAVGAILGVALVLVGLVTKLIVLAPFGFVLLVASCAYVTHAIRARRGASAAPSPTAARSAGLRSRMEDRLRRRFDES
jgi:Flp pilus assembly protein TadB